MPSRKADSFRWDSLVRLIHWGVAAACIANLWFNEAGETWHERLGYLAIILISVRLGWGLTFARGHARLSALVPTRAEFNQQARALRERTPSAPGHHGSGKLAVWALWLIILATAGSGWFQNTEMGFELDASDWHQWCTWALQAMIALHLCAIVLTSWRQRSNLLTHMLPGRRGGGSSAIPAQRDQPPEPSSQP